jgi:quercetin dioxygenase-like cupin family protein
MGLAANGIIRCKDSFLEEESKMKALLGLTAMLTMGYLVLAADAPSKVTFVGHDKVGAALAKGGPLVNGPDLLVSGSHRDKAGQVEFHDKETDVIYVIEGEATFVTGGTAVGLRQTKAGQSIGTEVKDGEAHHLTKGDVIVVPAGTPHWFKEVPKSVSYYVVKVLKP